MSFNMIKVTKENPCPVCHKPDWCGWYPLEEGSELICKRHLDGDNVYGTDGNFYVFCGFTSSGNARYLEANLKRSLDEQYRNDAKYSKTIEYKPRIDVFKSEPTRGIPAKSNKELDTIYRYLLSLLVLDDMHKKYLKEEGWSDELIECWKIKSFPENDFLRFKYGNSFSKNKYRKTIAKMVIDKFGADCLVGVPGAYKDKNGDWTFAGPKGILLPLVDANGYIYRLRIRMDFLDVRAKLSNMSYTENGHIYTVVPFKGIKEDNEWLKGSGKYRNLSSYHEENSTNSYDMGCEAGNNVSLYTQPKDSHYLAYLIEGEKKGIYCNSKLNAPFISLPGVNSWSKLVYTPEGINILKKLRQFGVQLIVVAFDADKETNAAVLKQESNAIQMLKDEGFLVGVAYWDASHGKGLDDLLKEGYKPHYDVA